LKSLFSVEVVMETAVRTRRKRGGWGGGENKDSLWWVTVSAGKVSEKQQQGRMT